MSTSVVIAASRCSSEPGLRVLPPPDRDGGAAGAEIWAYRLTPDHIHLIVTPADRNGLQRTFGEAHRRYTGAIKARLS